MGTETPSSSVAAEGMTAESLDLVARYFKDIGTSDAIPKEFSTKHFLSHFVRGLLKVDHIERGRVSCILSVKPAATNKFGGMHGGVVASVAKTVSIAGARTVVAKDKELFLGELSMSYLSAAYTNAELKVDASVIRSGRNLTVVAAEFKGKDTGKLIYTSRATFYNMPIASL